MTDNFLSKSHYDIVIVGAGLVGATLANLLAKIDSDLTIAVIDGAKKAELDLNQIDPRVVAITKKSKSVLQRAGVWALANALRVTPYTDMCVWDGEGTAEIIFNADDVSGWGPANNLGYIVENSVLTSCLNDNLVAAKHVDIAYQVNVLEVETSDSMECFTALILDNGQRITGTLITAADGAQSRLRQISGFEVSEKDYGHTAIVATVKTEKSHRFTAWQRFAKEGPLAFLPLSIDEHHCSIVWSIEHNMAKQIMLLDDEAFCRRLARTFEYKLGDVVSAESRVSFPLKQRHARDYTKPGIVLVGDAAHTIHPLAGQGANLGIYDVSVLNEEIERALTRNVPLSDLSLIKRYERRRRGHNQLAILAMDSFKRLFGSDNLGLRWLRNEGVRHINGNSWLKNQLAKLASGQV